MAQIKLTAADAADMPRIRALYKQAFPSAERMPFWMLRRKVRAGLAELLCIADERGGFLGLAAPLLDGDRVLMAYFAVAPEARGQGAGSLALAALLEGINCHINLIPVNPIEERSYRQTEADAVLKFKNMLEKYGRNVTIRREMGRDIQAACGQLRKKYMEQSGEKEG